MLQLLQSAAAVLSARAVPFALVGAGAMAAHGVSRSTADLDLLTVDGAVLDPAFWAPLAASGAAVDCRRGDDADPLAGVARLTSPGQRPLDVVVGRQAWMRQVLARAALVPVGGASIPVTTRPDLILLKLYAGGPQDGWDVEQLLAMADRGAVEATVEARIGDLPADAVRLWSRIRGGRR